MLWAGFVKLCNGFVVFCSLKIAIEDRIGQQVYWELKGISQLVLVPETWSSNISASIMRLGINEDLWNSIVAHSNDLSSTPDLWLDEEGFYAFSIALLRFCFEVGIHRSGVDSSGQRHLDIDFY